MPPKGHSIGAMRQRLTVQTPTTVTDAIGGQTVTWTSVAPIWGRVEPLAGQERAIAGQVQATASHRVSLRYRTDIGPQQRLLWGNRTLEILAAANEDGRNHLLICDCAEVTT